MMSITLKHSTWRRALAALVPLLVAPLVALTRPPDAASRIPTCETWLDITQAPASPTTSQSAGITVEYGETVTQSPMCLSTGGPDPSSFQFRVNGVDVTNAFSADYGMASASAVPLNVGMNTLVASVLGYASSGDQYIQEDTIQIEVLATTVTASVSPKGSAVTVPFGTSTSQGFTVANTGNTNATFSFTSSCSGVTSACSTPATVAISAGQQASVSVSYTTGDGGFTGRVLLRAIANGAVKDSGWANVTTTVAASQVTPDGGTVVAVRDTANIQTFRIKNTGIRRSRYALQVDCPAELAACTSPPSVTLAVGDSAFVPVSYRPTAVGRLVLRTANDSGWVNVEPASLACLTVIPCGNFVDSLDARASATDTARFTVRNRFGLNELFGLSCSVQAPVTGCQVVDSVAVDAYGTAEVLVPFTTSTGGTTPGVVTLDATPTRNIADSDYGQLWVRVGSGTQTLVVQPDREALTGGAGQANTVRFRLRNTSASTATALLSATCADGASQCAVPSSVPLAPGARGEVDVTFALAGGESSSRVSLQATLSGAPSVTDGGMVLADGYPMSAIATYVSGPPSTTMSSGDTASVRFRVQNTSAYAAEFLLSCTWGNAGTCRAPSRLRLGAGGDSVVRLALTAGLGSPATAVSFLVRGPANASASSPALTVRDAGVLLAAPDGDRLLRSACPITSAGPGAAVQCGDLLYAHALPGYRSMNKARGVTLLYNSATAHPVPVVALDIVGVPGETAPSLVEVGVWVNGTREALTYFSGTGLGSSQRTLRRVSIPLPPDSVSLVTGAYPIKAVVRRLDAYGTELRRDSVTSRLLVVNRRQSPFGAGWYVAGVERLYLNQDGAGSAMLVHGDGSAIFFDRSTGSFRSPPGEFSSLSAVTNGRFKRVLQGGRTTVWYGASGVVDSVTDVLGNKAQYAWTAGQDGWYPSALTDATGKVTELQPDPATGFMRLIKVPTLADVRLKVRTVVAGIAVLDSIYDPDSLATGFTYDALRLDMTSSRGRATGTVSYAYHPRLNTVDTVSGPAGSNVPPSAFLPWARAGLAPAGTGSSGTPAATSIPDSARFVVKRQRMVDGQPTWDGGAWFQIGRLGLPVRVSAAPFRLETVLTRDSVGQPIEIRSLVGTTSKQTRNLVRQTWDADGNLVLSVMDSVRGGWTNPDARFSDTTRYEYHPTFKTVTKVVSPATHRSPLVRDSVRIAYDPTTGLRTTITDAVGRVTRFTYWSRGMLRSIAEPNPADSTQPEPAPTVYAYDSTGGTWNLREVRKGASVTSYLYFGNGSDVQAVRDSLGAEVQYTYDGIKRVRTVTSVPGASSVAPGRSYNVPVAPTTVITTEYDDVNRVREVIDPQGQRSRWEHDPAGRVTRYCFRTNDCETTSYGDGRNPTLIWTRRGNRIDQGFGPTGELLWKVPRRFTDPYGYLGSATVEDSLAFGYDEAGRMTSATNRYSFITWDFDALGRLTREQQLVRAWTDTALSVPNARWYGVTAYHEYDRVGRRRRTFIGGPGTSFQAAPGGSAVLSAMDSIAYGYDVTGRLTKIFNSFLLRDRNSGDGREWQMTYDARGRLTTRTVPGHGTAEAFTYSDEDRVLTHQYATVLRSTETLTHDAIGRVTQVATPATAEQYAFDGAGRLVASWSGVGDTEYGYDALGNRIFEKDWESDYNASTHRLDVRRQTTLGSGCRIQFRYDGDGNQIARYPEAGTCPANTSADTTAYGADGRMLLRVVRRPITNGTARNPYTFWYDALGRRIYQRVDDAFAPDWGIRTYYWLDGNVAAKTWTAYQSPADTALVFLQEPVIGRQGDLLTSLSKNEWFWYAPGVDNVIAATAFTGADTIRLFHRDYRGSVVQVTTRTGGNTPYAPSAYLPFGSPAGANASSAKTNPGYNGHESGAGLVYMRNRWYDPNTGRFTQEDPIGYAGGINLYAYAGNDPVSYSDPYGLSPDSLKIVGAELEKAIADERASNPAADSVFTKLEQSPKWFLMADKGKFDCQEMCPFKGFSWGGKGKGDMAIIAPLKALLPNAVGASHVDVSRSNREGPGAGKVAWHEGVHLTGIVDRGSKYSHCTAPFTGVPNGCPP